MADQDWRALERAWRSAPGDQELLRRAIAARRRVGVGIPGSMRTAVVHPARSFASRRCPLRVWYESPAGEVVLAGRSGPRLPPLEIPAHLAWWVELHLDGFDERVPPEELLQAVIDEDLPGLALAYDQANDALLTRLEAATGLQLLHLFRPAGLTDAGLERLAGLELQRLRLEDCPGIGDAGLEALAQTDLARLEVWDCPRVTVGGLARLAAALPQCELRQRLPAALPRPGDRFGPYDVLAELGRGDACVVYRASHRRLGRTVALKLLPRGASSAEQQRFRLGLEHHARYDAHPNLPRAHEVGVHDGHSYLTLQPCAGSLDARIVEGPLPAREAARIARDVASALTALHADGLLHCHVKPQNVLLDADRALLTGLSLAVRKAGLGPNGPGGSPAWMAPEQASGDGDRIDARSDVYGVGACLYAMLSGEPPFQGQTAINVIYALLTRDPTPPEALRPDVDPDLAALSLRCLAKDPGQRPATAEELVRLLGG